MKTWTNPTVEELDVKLTSAFYAWWQVEEANGKLDDSLFWGTDAPQTPGQNPGQNPTPTPTPNPGDGDGGFGNES